MDTSQLGEQVRRCTCTEDESSDGSATLEDDPYCPVHGLVREIIELTSERDVLLARLQEAERVLAKVEAYLGDHDCAGGYVDEGEPFSCDGCDLLADIRDALAASPADPEKEEA